MPRINVVIAGDAAKLNKALAASERRMRKFASGLKTVGDGIFTAVGVPFIAAGAAGVKAAVDFEASMSKIKGLVGITGDELKRLEEAALRLGPQMGKSANEASEALFFITSAGLKGQDAIDVLTQSLKASAAGLGETKTIADLATSAMNAYGSENLSAAQATDALVAAVREGKLESTSLAGAMGAVLPIASAMGVQFNEVGAAFAAMSRTGTSADEAATQLKGILTSIIKPTTEAEEALAAMGLSSESLQQKLKDDGLLATLQLLNDRFRGNTSATAAVFGNVRALTGVLDLMGKNAAGTAEIFEKMADNVGDTDKAFAAAAETTQFKFNKALAELNSAAIKLGRDLIPMVTSVVDSISNLVNWFTQLDDSTRKVIVNTLKWTTILSGSVAIIGRVIQSVAATSAALRALGLTSLITSKAFTKMWSRFLLPLTAVVAALEGLEFMYNKLTPAQKAMTGPINGMMTGYNKLKQALGFANKAGEDSADISEELTSEYKAVSEQAAGMATSIESASGSITTMTRKMTEAEKQAALLREKMKKLIVPQDIESGAQRFGLPSSISSNENFSGKGIGAGMELPSSLFGTGLNSNEILAIQEGKAAEELAKITSAFDMASNAGQRFADIFKETAQGTGSAVEKMGKIILKVAGEIIKSALLGALSQWIMSSVTKLGIFGVPIAGAGFGIIQGLFNKGNGFNVPALAQGGMTTSAGYAMIGDNPSGKEFIIPYEKMGDFARRAMGGSNMNLSGQFVVRGSDLVLALERENRKLINQRGYGLNQ